MNHTNALKRRWSETEFQQENISESSQGKHNIEPPVRRPPVKKRKYDPFPKLPQQTPTKKLYVEKYESPQPPPQDLPEFRCISLRQPWADALLNGAKKIENRTYPIPPFLEHVWLALYVSKKFTATEESQMWEERPPKEVLEKTMGHLTGLVRFRQVSTEEAKELDPRFTDLPVPAEYHWLCSGRIKFAEPIPYSANVRWTRVPEPSLRQKFSKMLNDRGYYQKPIPVPKKVQKQIFSCPYCGLQRSKKVSVYNHMKRDHRDELQFGHFHLSPKKTELYNYPCCNTCDGTILSIGCDSCEDWWHETCLQLTFRYSHIVLQRLKSTDQPFRCPACVAKKASLDRWHCVDITAKK